MQKGFSLRALVDICAIPLTTLRNYRKRGIISPDIADKSGKLTLYSDSQIEIANLKLRPSSKPNCLTLSRWKKNFC